MGSDTTPFCSMKSVWSSFSSKLMIYNLQLGLFWQWLSWLPIFLIRILLTLTTPNSLTIVNGFSAPCLPVAWLNLFSCTSFGKIMRVFILNLLPFMYMLLLLLGLFFQAPLTLCMSFFIGRNLFVKLLPTWPLYPTSSLFTPSSISTYIIRK